MRKQFRQIPDHLKRVIECVCRLGLPMPDSYEEIGQPVRRLVRSLPYGSMWSDEEGGIDTWEIVSCFRLIGGYTGGFPYGYDVVVQLKSYHEVDMPAGDSEDLPHRFKVELIESRMQESDRWSILPLPLTDQFEPFQRYGCCSHYRSFLGPQDRVKYREHEFCPHCLEDLTVSEYPRSVSEFDRLYRW